jgi:hypothetical protein
MLFGIGQSNCLFSLNCFIANTKPMLSSWYNLVEAEETDINKLKGFALQSGLNFKYS